MTVSEQQRPEPAADALAALDDAAAAYREAREAVEAYGEAALEDLRDAHRRAVELLAGYEDKATDTGAEEFVNFAKFQSAFGSHVEGLDEDLPRRDAFETAKEAVSKTRLSPGDFERAREALEPAGELVERLDDRAAARDDLVEARKRARRRREEIEDAVAERERLLELADADLDAPIEAIREPIEAWNEGVAVAVQRLRTDVPVRELLDVLERAEQYPLVDLPEPSRELHDYLRSADVGEEPLARVLEYADYSQSKLDHYVADADRFRRRVATERSVLEAVSAEPLEVAWPPPPADVLPWRARELRGAVGGHVDDDALAALREVAAAARSDERYPALRRAAEADDALSATDRERVQSGAVEAELETHRRAIERLDERLAEVPEP